MTTDAYPISLVTQWKSMGTIVPGTAWTCVVCRRKDRRSIFVYGANEEFRHGKGSALEAKLKHGARNGIGPFCGNSYGICTKATPYQTLHLWQIAEHVAEFIRFVNDHPEYDYTVVRVGCGLAGFRDEQIAPLFVSLSGHSNVKFDPIWQAIHARMNDGEMIRAFPPEPEAR